MEEKIKQHGGLTNLLLNLALLGIVGALLIQAVNFVFYTSVSTGYFLDYRSLTIDPENPACTNANGHTVITAVIEREIYPYLPDRISKNKAIKAHGVGELNRGGREIENRVWEATYQWKENDTVVIDMEFVTVLLPGNYQLDESVWLEGIPYKENPDPIRVKSNMFKISGDLPKCK